MTEGRPVPRASRANEAGPAVAAIAAGSEVLAGASATAAQLEPGRPGMASIQVNRDQVGMIPASIRRAASSPIGSSCAIEFRVCSSDSSSST